jgi:hypothetical protein
VKTEVTPTHGFTIIFIVKIDYTFLTKTKKGLRAARTMLGLIWWTLPCSGKLTGQQHLDQFRGHYIARPEKIGQ